MSDKQKSVENMVMSIERNETQAGNSLESDSHGCFDFIEQKIVPFGEYYMTDNCLLCMCNKTERFCKQMGCNPIKCDGIVHKDPRNCCDVCTPSVILGTPVDHASASLKLGGMTITFLIIVSTVFFMLHRLRRKRLLITVRRCQSGDGNFQPFCESFERSCVACPPHPPPIPTSRTVFERRPNAVPTVHYNDPPPPYSATVAQPPPLLTASAIARMPHYFNGPPPPYPSSSRRQHPPAESSLHSHRCPAHGYNGAGRRSLPELFSPAQTFQWSNSRKPSEEEVGDVGELQAAATNCCSSSASAVHSIRDDASSIASTATTTSSSTSDCSSNSSSSSGGSNGSSTSCSTECECQHYLKDVHSSVPNSTQVNLN